MNSFAKCEAPITSAYFCQMHFKNNSFSPQKAFSMNNLNQLYQQFQKQECGQRDNSRQKRADICWGKLRECKSFSNKYSIQNILFCDIQYCLFPEILHSLPVDAERDCSIKFQLIVSKTPSLFLLLIQSTQNGRLSSPNLILIFHGGLSVQNPCEGVGHFSWRMQQPDSKSIEKGTCLDQVSDGLGKCPELPFSPKAGYHSAHIKPPNTFNAQPLEGQGCQWNSPTSLEWFSSVCHS